MSRSLLLLFFALSFLFVMGLIMIFNTSSAEVIDLQREEGTHIALLRQMLYAWFGIVLGCCVFYMGTERWIRFSPLLFTLCIIALVAVLIPGIGRMANGSRRWLQLGPLSFQPSEALKIVLAPFFLYLMSKQSATSLNVRAFMRIMAFFALPLFLILIEPNHGCVALITMQLIVLLFLSRVKMQYWALPLAILLSVGGIAASSHPYVTARLNAYLHPESDLQGKGHQPYQAKIAVGSGGLFGKGPGQSVQKFHYLPEAQNDYIAAIFAEEFGFIGMLMLVFAYLSILWNGFATALKTLSSSKAILAASSTFLICIQAFLNLAVVAGLLPSTGLNLPFFSQGGSSLLANCVNIALLLRIIQDEFVGEKKEGGEEKRKRRI